MEEKNNPEERVYTPARGAVIDQEIPTLGPQRVLLILRPSTAGIRGLIDTNDHRRLNQ